MKKNIIYWAALAVIAAACSNEESLVTVPANNGTDEVKMITETVSATNGDEATRADVDADAKFTWSTGDQIAVHVSDGKYYTTAALAAGGSKSAEFTVTYPDGQARDAFAVYPASIVSASAANYGQSGKALDVTLPSSYTLAEVSGTTTPCPMIATNTPGSGWTFKQLCGLVRLTASDIPSTAKRLEIDFDGKKVCGDFSIASDVSPGTSVISTTTDWSNDIITITKDGTNTTLGATSLVLNIPLPVGAYSNITVVAYDALSGGSPLKMGNVTFSYTATKAKGARKAVAVTSEPTTSFTFTFKNQGSDLAGLRFVRLLSSQNKLHKDATTYGPYTTAAVGTTDPDIANPVSASMLFDRNPNDLLAFQVIAADGKVYAGSYDVPASSFRIGKSYDLTVNANTYTFTVDTGKKVYFSPGDLGVDGDVYSFTEPFETWGWGNADATKRVWFNYGEIASGHDIYGLNWRNFNSLTESTKTTQPQEWDNVIKRTNMNSGVKPYYRVTVAGHANCLLLPPDETESTDIGEDITSGTVNDYAKYLGKGFVLLISTGRGLYQNGYSWSLASQGWYWALWKNMSQNRTYFSWTDSGTPVVSWASNQFRMRVRYVRDVN